MGSDEAQTALELDQPREAFASKLTRHTSANTTEIAHVQILHARHSFQPAQNLLQVRLLAVAAASTKIGFRLVLVFFRQMYGLSYFRHQVCLITASLALHACTHRATQLWTFKTIEEPANRATLACWSPACGPLWPSQQQTCTDARNNACTHDSACPVRCRHVQQAYYSLPTRAMSLS